MKIKISSSHFFSGQENIVYILRSFEEPAINSTTVLYRILGILTLVNTGVMSNAGPRRNCRSTGYVVGSFGNLE